MSNRTVLEWFEIESAISDDPVLNEIRRKLEVEMACCKSQRELTKSVRRTIWKAKEEAFQKALEILSEAVNNALEKP